jgi:hypothetical protein
VFEVTVLDTMAELLIKRLEHHGRRKSYEYQHWNQVRESVLTMYSRGISLY